MLPQVRVRQWARTLPYRSGEVRTHASKPPVTPPPFVQRERRIGEAASEPLHATWSPSSERTRHVLAMFCNVVQISCGVFPPSPADKNHQLFDSLLQLAGHADCPSRLLVAPT